MKYDIDPIQETYRGYQFRSFLEIRWAVAFSEMGYDWCYEPRSFNMGNGSAYTPDFYIKDQDMWVEIKPIFNSDERDNSCLVSRGVPENLVIDDIVAATHCGSNNIRYGSRSYNRLDVSDSSRTTKRYLWEMFQQSPHSMSGVCAEYIVRMCALRQQINRGDWVILYGAPGESIGFDFRFHGSRPLPLTNPACKRASRIKSPFQP